MKLTREKLRKIIREEMDQAAQADKYVVVDSEEPLDDDGPMFEGTKEEVKNWWFEQLEKEDIGGYALISKEEYDDMLLK